MDQNAYARNMGPRTNETDQPDRIAERQAQILGAASRVLAERGARALRLSDVADEAGVSIGMVQHYFRTRADLLLHTFRSAYEEAAGALDAISAQEPDPSRRLVQLVRHSIRVDRWPLWLEYWGAAYREPEIRSRCEGEYRRWAGHFFDTIEAGVEDGSFTPADPVDDIADRLLVLIDGLAVRLLLQDARIDHERALHLIGEALRRELGLAADPIS